MDCIEAQRLIDQGITPGSQPPVRAELGFHLARCQACRTHQVHTTHTRSSAPAQPPVNPSPLSPQRQQVITTRPARPRGKTHKRNRKTQLFVLALLAGLPLLVVCWIAGIAIRTNQNLEAMIVATLTPTATPAAPAEASTPTPSPASDSEKSAPATPAATPTSPPGTTAETTSSDSATLPTIQPQQPQQPQQAPTQLDIKPPPAGDAVNVLLLGIDRRPDQQTLPHTDVMMLARVDPQQKRIALLSLLRDLWVEIPGHGYSRINNAYRFGEAYAPGNGLALARATVSDVLDIPIDYVILVDFQGFIGLIDTLGGITVYVEKELYDPQYPTMDYGYQVAHFLPGPEDMDGQRALMYSRIRHPDSDFMRIRRQQAVLAAIGSRLHARGDLKNLLAIDRISGALVGYVQTDMPGERIIGLVWALRDYNSASIERYTMTSDMVSVGVGTDHFALVPHPESLALLTDLFMGTR